MTAKSVSSGAKYYTSLWWNHLLGNCESFFFSIGIFVRTFVISIVKKLVTSGKKLAQYISALFWHTFTLKNLGFKFYSPMILNIFAYTI